MENKLQVIRKEIKKKKSKKAKKLAKEGQIDEAVDFFRGNIRDYTEDAKDKFIAKLERYKDE